MHVIDLTTFRLRAGVADADFLAADARVQTDLAYQRPGLVRRTTARGDDGRWLVLTLWASADDADRAANAATDIEFESLVDAASRRTERYTPLE